MTLISQLSPGRNVGVKPSDVLDLYAVDLMAERSGFAADVAGGYNGDVFIVDTLAESGPTSIRAALADPDPLWIVPIVTGVVNLTSEIVVGSFKTLDGRAGILNFDGKRLNASDAREVILCNFGVRNSDNDGITFRGSDMIWVHHASLTSCADGLLDISRAKEGDYTARHTVSSCKFTNHNKCSLVGLHNDTANSCPWDHYIQATYRHNRMHCTQRQPRLSRGYLHAFNNVIYFDRAGMQSYDRGKLLSERNWFRKVGDGVAFDFTMAPYTNGRIRSVGNVFENGAANASSNPTGVLDPPYTYSAQMMTAALRDAILDDAGATLSLPVLLAAAA
jgi:pectate lyase